MAMIPGRIPGRERWEVEDKLILSDAVGQTGELKIYGGTAGEKALEIFYGSYSIFSILATGSTVQLLGGSVKPIQIGDAGTTSHTFNTNDDLFVSGRLEVDGRAYFDGNVYFGTDTIVNANRSFFVGGHGALAAVHRGDVTFDQYIIALGADIGTQIVITDGPNILSDHDHADQANPTMFVHSATDPDSANDEWISICHDVNDGVIAVGSGTLNLGGSTINIVNATRTASTVTHDSYVVIEIGGSEYKFMLGS